MMRKSFLFALGLVFVAAFARARAEEVASLRPDLPVQGTLPAQADPPAHRIYRFDVPADVVAIRIELDARADLDLLLAEKPRFEKEEELVASSKETTGRERITATRWLGERPLKTGRYFVEVVYPAARRPEPPRAPGGRAIAEIPYKLRLVEIRARIDGALAAGRPVKGEIDPEDGAFRTFTIEVPEGARALRIDLSEAPADLGLRARHGKPILDPDEAEVEARSPLGTETILVEPGGDPPLEPGRWYVDVFDEVGLGWKVPFTIRASFAKDPDPALLALPRPPAPRTPLERALFSTVEIVGEDGAGSGVLIGERGMILTNYHVVREKVENDLDSGAPLVIALTIDPRDPPHEAFRARVVTANADADLALVEVVSGLYGQALPPDYRFVAAAIGAPERLEVGAPLYAVGYPEAGGEGSRVSVTVTRGIVAGFERRGRALHIKTDAMINAGNSGGAALDERFELVGLPTETISDEEGNGQIGFVRPIWLVPGEWWQLAGLARER
jgi:hypothetical protein